jgi:hypothetical protein
VRTPDNLATPQRAVSLLRDSGTEKIIKERSRYGAADAITLQGALRFMIIGGHEKDPAR